MYYPVINRSIRTFLLLFFQRNHNGLVSLLSFRLSFLLQDYAWRLFSALLFMYFSYCFLSLLFVTYYLGTTTYSTIPTSSRNIARLLVSTSIAFLFLALMPDILSKFIFLGFSLDVDSINCFKFLHEMTIFSEMSFSNVFLRFVAEQILLVPLVVFLQPILAIFFVYRHTRDNLSQLFLTRMPSLRTQTAIYLDRVLL